MKTKLNYPEHST